MQHAGEIQVLTALLIHNDTSQRPPGIPPFTHAGLVRASLPRIRAREVSSQELQRVQLRHLLSIDDVPIQRHLAPETVAPTGARHYLQPQKLPYLPSFCPLGALPYTKVPCQHLPKQDPSHSQTVTGVFPPTL